MKIITWNLNGLKSSLKTNLLEFIEKYNADTYCFQEIKISKNQIEDLSKKLVHKHYKPYFYLSEKNGYSGLLSYSKIEPNNIIEGIGNEEFDREARVQTLVYDKYFLINAYFPHTSRELARLPFKLKFNQKFENFCKNLKSRPPSQKLRRASNPLLIAGDFNVAHKEIDLKNPKANKNNAGFTLSERKWFDKFLADGYIDVFRYFDKSSGKYTWWSYRKDVRAKNIGWRIDYFVVSNELRSKLKSCRILQNEFGSDHAPVEMEIVI